LEKNLANIAVMVTTGAADSKTATAIQFVKTIIEHDEHQLEGVFFYQAGVSNANTLTSMPSDELQALSQWQSLVEQHQINLYLCITAAEKRGMTDEEQLNNIAPCFVVAGLGELVELTNKCDRVIQL